MSMGKLPEGWVDTLLGNVVEYGKTSKKDLSNVNGDTWVLELEDIEKDSSKLLNKVVASNRPFKSTKNSFKKGDVLYGKLRPYLNKIIIANDDGVCTTEIIPINAEPICCNKYFFYWLKSSAFLGYVNDVSYGVNMPRLGTSDGIKAPLRLAPLAEQKIIAEKLDTLLAQVDSTKARLEQIPKILKRFRQSVIDAAATGRLTGNWQSNHSCTALDVIKIDEISRNKLYELEPWLKNKKSSIESNIDQRYIFKIPSNWKFTSWGKVSEWITYGFTRPMPKTDVGIKLLTAKDVKNFTVRIDEGSHTSEEAFNNLSEKDKPNEGDLLITKDGSIGRAALVRTNEKFCINQSVAVCWLRTTSMNKYFLEIVANCTLTQAFIKDKSQGMAIQHLSIIDYAKCPLPVPPLPEQHEIVRRVEQLFAYADTIEKQVNTALARVNNLTQSILAKAFRGELTAQWRAENPELISGENSAAALLEKIKAERAASTGKKATRKKS
ncbi:restriction endonuclease subunit S [Erwinia sp. MMLR14_017]|uniref:restriction endonuclease subunit S n=1 Tax=Erwinia sp. MMLR14_017 TaxID=3093842 RepID=UPI00298FE0A1|nr:restriction endonuclease subunit S [Erwinia sp. MMLR14_017]MDW8847658.1 restriction endonuclease subunit S [Erwinia sp. MMLR14_017]